MLKLKTDKIVFNYCARAIIKHNKKFLLICVNDAPYCHLPSGQKKRHVCMSFFYGSKMIKFQIYLLFCDSTNEFLQRIN